MKKIVLAAIGVLSLTMVLALTAIALPQGHVAYASGGGSTTTVDVSATLVGTSAFPNAKGAARYRDDGTGKRSYHSEVINTNLPENTLIDEWLDGVKIASKLPILPANSLFPTGTFYNPSTDVPGQFVPVAHVGSVVQFRTQDGTVIASGTFR